MLKLIILLNKYQSPSNAGTKPPRLVLLNFDTYPLNFLSILNKRDLLNLLLFRQKHGFYSIYFCALQNSAQSAINPFRFSQDKHHVNKPLLLHLVIYVQAHAHKLL